MCIRVLAGIVSQEASPAAARVAAANALLDRGWGKAVQLQHLSSQDGSGIQIVIRQILDPARMIEHDTLAEPAAGVALKGSELLELP
jgi:hypothetical protein